jgi:hypothetical protein
MWATSTFRASLKWRRVEGHLLVVGVVVGGCRHHFPVCCCLFGFRSCALNDWTRAILWLTAGLVFFFLGVVVVMPGVF